MGGKARLIAGEKGGTGCGGKRVRRWDESMQVKYKLKKKEKSQQRRQHREEEDRGGDYSFFSGGRGNCPRLRWEEKELHLKQTSLADKRQYDFLYKGGRKFYRVLREPQVEGGGRVTFRRVHQGKRKKENSDNILQVGTGGGREEL